MKRQWRGILLAIVGGAGAAALVASCNLFVRLDDGCQRDEDCRAGEVCNVRRHFCALPVVERCNGIDDDGDGRSDTDENWGLCQPTVGMNQCGGRRMCVREQNRWQFKCEPNAAEQEEICLNGIDDNCNGLVDEGADCEVNYARSPALQVGSDVAADGEGDDSPAHSVCLAQFTLDRYEVTQAQFAVFLGTFAPERLRVERPTRVLNSTVTYGRYVIYRNDRGDDVNLLFVPNRVGVTSLQLGEGFALAHAEETERFPVTGVTWMGAAMYCDWAGKHLPTEAEFFRAARGADGTRPFPWGADPPTCDLANIGTGGSDGGPCVGSPVAVDSNPMGASVDGRAFHLYGNANEWMYDWLDTNLSHTQNRYYGSLMPDGWCQTFPEGPTGPSMGSPISQPEDAGLYCQQCRFARGRHYRTVDTRIGIRRWLDPDRSDETVGFRCSRGGAVRPGVGR